MNLAPLDWAIVIVYLIVLFGLGWSFIRKKISDSHYLLAARKLSLPAFVMSLVTTWYGAILGVGEFVHGFGVVAWVVNGLVWYVVYLLFAFFLARRVRASKMITVADQFEKNVGPMSGRWAAVMTFIMSSPAPYVLSLGLILQDLLGMSFDWAILVAIFVSAAYIWVGGFKAVVRTDALQFLFMFLGFGALLGFSIHEYGGMEFLRGALPESHLTFQGELSWQTILVWGLLAFWTFVDPNFYQRCYAIKDAKLAARGILIATVFWFIFDMLTLGTGLYARAAFPDADPQMAYFALSDAVLPLAAKGLFVVTILSIIMSTIDSFLFASSSIVSVDFIRKKFPNSKIKAQTRIGIVITLAISVCLIYLFESIIGLIYAIGSVGVSTLLLPILLVLFNKSQFSDRWMLLSMVLTALVSGTWMVEGWLNAEWGWPVYRLGIEPMYIGILASAVVLTLGSLGKHLPALKNEE